MLYNLQKNVSREDAITIIKNTNFKFIEGDILNEQEFSKIFEQYSFEIVFHLAANSDISLSYNNPNIDFNNTLISTYNVLMAMKKYKIKKFMFASSSAVYGETDKLLNEDFGPLFPVSHYGASKLASEAFISSFSNNYDIQSFIIRFPNVVGERSTHGVIKDFIKKLQENNEELKVLGNGEQKKQYLYIQDLIDAILFIIKNSQEKINYFNIGPDSHTKVKDIAKFIIKEMNVNAKIKYSGGKIGWKGDVPFFNYNLDKIHELGWRAKYNSDDAVKTAIKKMLEKSICN